MPTYTVHAPLPKLGEAAIKPERFVFVRDGFHFWAFLLPPLWLLIHRLWLALFLYLLLGAGLATSIAMFTPPVEATFDVVFLTALLLGFEASTLRRWTLARHGWKTLGFVVGDDQESAERRFFSEWMGRTPSSPAADTQHQAATMRRAPARVNPESGNNVIGSFPEPEPKR